MSLLMWLGAHVFLHNLWIFLTVFLTKGLILFGMGYAATKLFPSLMAEHKHAIWFLIILAFVVLPVVRLFIAVVPISLPDSNGSQSVSRLVTLPLAYSERVTSIIDASSVDSGAACVTAQRLLLLLPVTLWTMGVVFFIVRYLGGRVALWRLAVSPAVSPPLRLPLGELARRLRIRRKLSLVYSSRCAIPLTYGWLHPRIMLPTASRAWPNERLRAVLIHELTHIKRADCLRNAFVYLVCAFLWFNPFAWLAREFMLRESEMSCDRSVLATGTRGTEYASTIVDLARAARGNLLLPGAYGFLGKKSLLAERVSRVLTPGSGTQSIARVRTGRVLLFCFSLLLPIFAITYSLKVGKLSTPVTQLFGVVFAGTPQQVQAAIDTGADVNAQDTSGQTVLMKAAAFNRNAAVTAVLLRDGADTELRDPIYGGTALLWAAMYNENPAVITTLLKGGAGINARNSLNGWTALMKAAMYNQNPAVIITLLKAGADAKAKNNAGETALDYARSRAMLSGTDAYRQLREASQQRGATRN